MHFTWKDEYSTGIKEIDDQHQKLFEVGRKVFDIVFNNKFPEDQKEFASIFYELRMYTQYHFTYEEMLLKENGYPFYETHKREHGMLIKRMEKIENGLDPLRKDASMELINFMCDWISHHILKSDKKYQGYIKGK